MSRPTPGPWEARTGAGYNAVQTAGRRKKADKNGGFVIAEFYGPDAKANALAASATMDLVEAVAGYRMANSLCRCVWCQKMNAALEKAGVRLAQHDRNKDG